MKSHREANAHFPDDSLTLKFNLFKLLNGKKFYFARKCYFYVNSSNFVSLIFILRVIGDFFVAVAQKYNNKLFELI